MFARMIVIPQASPLMKVTTEIKRHEQKEKSETVREADFAVDLTAQKLR